MGEHGSLGLAFGKMSTTFAMNAWEREQTVNFALVVCCLWAIACARLSFEGFWLQDSAPGRTRTRPQSPAEVA
eukprot:3934965-Rhodomonas_salina.2